MNFNGSITSCAFRFYHLWRGMANWIFMYCSHFCLLWSQLPCCKKKTGILSKDLNRDIKETFWCIVWSALFCVSCIRYSHSLSCNYPIFFLSPEPTFFYLFIYLLLPQHNLCFSRSPICFNFSSCAAPHLLVLWMLSSGVWFELIIIQPLQKAERESDKGKGSIDKEIKRKQHTVT